MERGEMLVVVVRRRPGPYTLEREGGGGDVARSRHWCREMEGGGGDEVARTLRARAGGWWWWWPGSLLSAPPPPPLSSLPPPSIPGPLPPSRPLSSLSLPCLPGRALACSPPRSLSGLPLPVLPSRTLISTSSSRTLVPVVVLPFACILHRVHLSLPCSCSNTFCGG